MLQLLEGTEGYSEELNTEYIHILQGFMENSIYESGFSFEDGYTASKIFNTSIHISPQYSVDEHAISN